MPAIVNPMDALKSFQPALLAGEITLQPGHIDPNVFVHLDHPNGESRLTYVTLNGNQVTALAVLSSCEEHEGKPCFQLGYAVPQHLRKRGLAKAVAKAAIAELSAGLRRSGVPHIVIEAVVGKRNVGSQKVAEAIFGLPVQEGTDEHSGEEIFQYILNVDTTDMAKKT